jgi:hypothetical protein
MQAEGVVFVLRNFDCADAVPLKDESSPWRRRACAMADRAPGEQWNAAVSDHDRDAWADIAGLESVLAQMSQPQSDDKELQQEQTGISRNRQQRPPKSAYPLD